MLVAEVADRIVGLRAFLRWRFVASERVIRAVRAVDTATHPDVRRRGIFSRLTKEALRSLRQEADLVFNTPNSRSGPGYLKLGWHRVGKASVAVRIKHPLRVLRGIRSSSGDATAERGDSDLRVAGVSAHDALSDDEALSGLLDEADPPDGRLMTDRDLRFLRWRYGDAPLLDYRAVREFQGERLSGLAVFRIRRRGMLWQCSVADVIVGEGDVRTAKRLLRGTVAAAPVDFVACRMPPGSAPARAAHQLGFVPSPGGLTFVVNPLRQALATDPTSLRSWALNLGDLEVF
jgi:hypothetical protein